MSERPMTTPDGIGPDYSRAELTMALPPDWPIHSKEERHYWPFRSLRASPRSRTNSTPGSGSTTRSRTTTRPSPTPTTPASAARCSPYPCSPARTSSTCTTATTPSCSSPIHPLFEDETNLKLNEGAKALNERLEAAGVTELLDPTRPSVT